MGGDGYALALRAGAELIDMEFVQFFPIGHLAPRLIGMDPIMWDPFRYKLGGSLLNGLGQEFIDRYGSTDDGRYVVTRDRATYAITKEVEAGRGSPNGGAWLSFGHIAARRLAPRVRTGDRPVAAAGIDLGRDDVEVAPIAHYHMGGIWRGHAHGGRRAGLFAAGEAVGGANGANRLSGNAITEALAFGRAGGTKRGGMRYRGLFDPRPPSPPPPWLPRGPAAARQRRCSTGCKRSWRTMSARFAPRPVWPLRLEAVADTARRTRRFAARRAPAARPGARRLVRSAPGAAGGRVRHHRRDRQDREPGRPSAGGFSGVG